MKTTTHSCFGWEVTHVCLAPGETFSIVVPKDTVREHLSNTTFYTVGRLSAKRKSNDFLLSDRNAGFFSRTDLPSTLVRGTNVLSSAEPCEWWCFDALQNGSTSPTITPIVLKQGQAHSLQVGDNVLVCQGSAKVGTHVFDKASAFSVVSENKELIAHADVFALVFDAVRSV